METSPGGSFGAALGLATPTALAFGKESRAGESLPFTFFLKREEMEVNAVDVDDDKDEYEGFHCDLVKSGGFVTVKMELARF